MLKVMIGYLIGVLVYITAVLILVKKLAPFAQMLEKVFCDGEKPDDLPAPPSTSSLPPAPAGTPSSDWNQSLQELIDALNDFEITPGP